MISEWRGGNSALDNAACILHGDVGAYNTIFQAGIPVAFIDWDTAHPGNPVEDLAYLAWTWCIQSSENVPVCDQALHLRELADGYDAASLQLGIDELLDHIIDAQQNMINAETEILTRRTTQPGRIKHAHIAIEWAKADREMLLRRRAEFVDTVNES